jgi:hypothetical protein
MAVTFNTLLCPANKGRRLVAKSKARQG